MIYFKQKYVQKRRAIYERKKINYLLIIDVLLTLVIAVGLFLSLKECKKDKIYSKWEVSFSMQLNERVDGENILAGTILNDETTTFSIDIFSADEYVPIKINAKRYSYLNENKENVIETTDGLTAYKNTNNIQYSYTGKDGNVEDNLVTHPIFPTSLEQGYLYLKLDEGIHEIKFIFPSVNNIVGAEYKAIINVSDNRKDGLAINFASNYIKKYTASETGDYDLYFIDNYPSFELSLDGTSVGVFDKYTNNISDLSNLFGENDRIRLTMIATRAINGVTKFIDIGEIEEKGLYFIQVSAKDSWEYKSIVYRCYVFLV